MGQVKEVLSETAFENIKRFSHITHVPPHVMEGLDDRTLVPDSDVRDYIGHFVPALTSCVLNDFDELPQVKLAFTASQTPSGYELKRVCASDFTTECLFPVDSHLGWVRPVKIDQKLRFVRLYFELDDGSIHPLLTSPTREVVVAVPKSNAESESSESEENA